ncbi:MAG TPA: ATP-dependent protease LonB [Candidatus Fimadaptatus faecigallinarum]|uniref:endopeptidase La n=1 Tax=Candidatus Fimadaptatus faecigallinarum TaxID=2840814 RepID=A0A9D1S434_9FIRM|nr:ATP-dependent protease LonB [Candidatus Fimadaptatus faecigallinarum]
MLTAIMLIQLAVTIVVGIYFFRQLRAQGRDTNAPRVRGSSMRELEHLSNLRKVHLSRPLGEQVRPTDFNDIIGQEEGIRALKAILCSPNPQHVIIYGPPGIGKTCAARLVLEAAKRTPGSPFKADAPFIEVDATCVRFDERSIADSLIGSVHDPIYQGAGLLGVSGIPQPKEGAVTRAHGGVLFLDEIGELHPTQMNKLLKVLEDRMVRFESAYYNPDDTSVPRHIRDIFDNGLPADFRLVGATTRSPEELPPALRSRCMEIYFRALEPDELARIAAGAAARVGFDMAQSEATLIGGYSASGRDAVNIVQMASGLAQMDGRHVIKREDVEWVVDSCHYAPHTGGHAHVGGQRVGIVNGLAVQGFQGAMLDIEAVALPGEGRINVTGIIEEEELGSAGHKLRRRSTARASVENIATLLRGMGLDMSGRDVHINFPGGMPVDGPSAGVAMAAAAYSALTGCPLDSLTAVTGEITVRGEVRAVGGVPDKISAAIKAGMRRVIIPADNYLERYAQLPVRVIPVSSFKDALSYLADVEDLPADAACVGLDEAGA